MKIEVIFLIKCNYVYIASYAYDPKPRDLSFFPSFSNTFAHFCFSCKNVITVYENISDFLEQV